MKASFGWGWVGIAGILVGFWGTVGLGAEGTEGLGDVGLGRAGEALGCGEVGEADEVEVVSMKELKWRSGVYHRGEVLFTGVGVREEDGVMRQRLEMKEGVFHGVTREWNEAGVKITETHWKEGVRHGKNTYWNPDGSLQKVQVYEEGKEVSVEHFPSGGGE